MADPTAQETPPVLIELTERERQIADTAWQQGYLRGQYPWRTADESADPIPDGAAPPQSGANASPYAAAQRGKSFAVSSDHPGSVEIHGRSYSLTVDRAPDGYIEAFQLRTADGLIVFETDWYGGVLGEDDILELAPSWIGGAGGRSTAQAPHVDVYPETVEIDGETYSVSVSLIAEDEIDYFNLTDSKGELFFEADWVASSLSEDEIREIVREELAADALYDSRN